MSERFIVDDAGTLIDMHTRDTFDIVEEVCPLLNEKHEQIQSQSIVIQGYQERCDEAFKENEELKSTLYFLLNVIQNKCPKDYPKCKDIVRSCFENDFNNIENDSTNSRNERR